MPTPAFRGRNQAFAFIGSSAFGHVAWQLRSIKFAVSG